MATFAGLMVEVGADIKQFVSEMTKIEAISAKQARAVAKEFDSLGSKIGGFIGAGAFAYLIKGSIDAMDALNDLNKTTGISVETLGALGIAAAQSGSDLAGVAAGINKLGQNIGKETERFAKLGITAKDPLEALKQFADVFNQIEDPQLRAAVASEALGKQWQALAPLLSEGSQGIADMIEKNKEWALVTADTAKQADEFNDKVALFTKSGAAMATLVGPMLPLLNKLADQFLDVSKKSLQTASDWKPLLEAGKAVTVIFGNIWYVLKTVGNEIGGIAAQIMAMLSGDFERVASIGSMMEVDAVHARQALDKWEKGIMAIGTSAETTAFSVDGLASTYEKAGKAGNASLVKKAKAFLDNGKAAKEAAEEQKKFLEMVAKAEEKQSEFFAKDYQEAWEFAFKYITKEEKEALEERMRLGEIYQKQQDMAAEDMTEAWVYYNKFVIEQNKKMLDEAEDMYGGFLKGIDSAFRDVWDSLLEGKIKSWSDALRSMREIFKRTLIDFIYTTLAKPFIISLVGSFAGLLGMEGLSALAAQQAGSSAGGSIIGSAVSAGASWAGEALGLTGAGGFFSNVAAGYTMSGYGSMATGYAMGETASTIGYAIGEVLAAIPVWGWIAAAVLAIGALVGAQHKGGPKVGGSFGGTFDANGNFISSASFAGSDNGRLFTPNQADSAMRDLGTSFVKNFVTTLGRLGGSLGSSTITPFLGFDMDPNGTAQGRVSGALMMDGKTIFEWLDKNSGRDDADIQKAFGEVMSRMMLSGLQAASGSMRKGVAAILNSVVASTATPEEVTAVVELAAAFSDLMAVIEAPFTSGGVIEAASRTSMDLFGEQGKALTDLAGKTSLTVEETKRLTEATVAYKQSAMQLILTLTALKTAIGSTIDGLIEQTALAGMSGQQKFNYWQDKAQSLYEQMLSSNDPAEIERLFGEFTTAWNNAWSMLTPEQQAAEGAEWGRRLKAAKEEINKHINSLIEGVVTDTNATLKVVGDKMDEAAVKMQSAATTQSSAASTFSNAVDRGVNVTIILDQYGNPIVNGSAA